MGACLFPGPANGLRVTCTRVPAAQRPDWPGPCPRGLPGVPKLRQSVSRGDQQGPGQSECQVDVLVRCPLVPVVRPGRWPSKRGTGAVVARQDSGEDVRVMGFIGFASTACIVDNFQKRKNIPSGGWHLRPGG
jgi:hypothetical protein